MAQSWPLAAPGRGTARLARIWPASDRCNDGEASAMLVYAQIRRRRRLKCLPHQVAGRCRIQSINIVFLSPSSYVEHDMTSGAISSPITFDNWTFRNRDLRFSVLCWLLMMIREQWNVELIITLTQVAAATTTIQESRAVARKLRNAACISYVR